MLRLAFLSAAVLVAGCDAGVFTEDGQPFHVSEVDPRPQPVGGYAALAAAVEYPRLAREAGIEGEVTVQLDVLPDEVRGAQVLSSPSDLLSEAALRVVGGSRDASVAPGWVPGRMGRREVATRVRVCIAFRLLGAEGRVEARDCSV